MIGGKLEGVVIGNVHMPTRILDLRITPWWLTGLEIQFKRRTVPPSFCTRCRRELRGADWFWSACIHCGPVRPKEELQT